MWRAGCAAVTPPCNSQPGGCHLLHVSAASDRPACVLCRASSTSSWAGESLCCTRLRPHCKESLEKVARLYELHVFTFGSRLYAHTIAGERLMGFCPAWTLNGLRVGLAPLFLNGGSCRWREGQRLCLPQPWPRGGGWGAGAGRACEPPLCSGGSR